MKQLADAQSLSRDLHNLIRTAPLVRAMKTPSAQTTYEPGGAGGFSSTPPLRLLWVDVETAVVSTLTAARHQLELEGVLQPPRTLAQCRGLRTVEALATLLLAHADDVAEALWAREEEFMESHGWPGCTWLGTVHGQATTLVQALDPEEPPVQETPAGALTARECHEAYGVNVHTLNTWRKRGKLAAEFDGTRGYVYQPEDVERQMAA